jgi:hypothetical protein
MIIVNRIGRQCSVAFCALIAANGALRAQPAWGSAEVLRDVPTKMLNCTFFSLGRMNIKPESRPDQHKNLSILSEAGVIKVTKYYKSFVDPSREMGEYDADVEMGPNMDPADSKEISGRKCLATGLTATNFELISIDSSEKKLADGTTRKIVVAQGKFENVGTPTRATVAINRAMRFKGPVQKGKFRVMYVFEPFKAQWQFRAMDVGDIDEGGFRTSYVERAMEQQ